VIKAAITVKKMLGDFHQKLDRLYERAEVQQFICRLFEHRLGWSSARIHSEPGFLLSPEVSAALYQDLTALAAGKPVQYIIGETEFMGLRFFVNPDVLIPRPETEGLVELVLEAVKQDKKTGLSILDIGTGSGCIAVTLKLGCPGVRVVAVDKSLKALEVAERNATLNGCAVTFVHADLLSSEFPGLPGHFDFIVSNPPYVTEQDKSLMNRNVLEHEPPEALFVPGADPLLFYRAIAAYASGRSQDDPVVFAEINENLGQETAAVFLSLGWKNVRVLKDTLGKDRYISASQK
jgi:release factor glutamine methyltransferase